MSELQLKQFQQINDALKAHNLHSHVTITQKQKVIRRLGSQGWDFQTGYTLEASGEVDKRDEIEKVILELKQKAEANPTDFHAGLYTSFSIQYKLNVGDKLPKFENLTRVFEGTVTNLEHKQGEVMLIDVWATWCGPCQKPMQHNQDMLAKNAEAWKDRVRIVGVSVDEDLGKLKNRIETKEWKLIEHLTLGKWDGEHNLIKMFKVNGIPFVALVGPDGRIEYTGHPSGGNLENRINQLLSGLSEKTEKASAPASKTSDETTQLSEADFEKIHKAISNPELDAFIGKADNFELQVTKISRSAHGKESITATKLKLNYTCQLSQAPVYQAIVDTLSKDVGPASMIIDAYVQDKELELKTHFEKTNQIYKAHNGKGDLVLSTTYRMNLAEQADWLSTSQIHYPKLSPADIKMEDAKAIINDINVYSEDLQERGRDVAAIAPLAQKLPIQPIGNRLADIPETPVFRDRSTKVTPKHDGKSVWAIVYAGSNNTSSNHVNEVLKVAQEVGNVQVFVFADGGEEYSKAEQIEKNLPGTHVLARSIDAAEFLAPFSIQSWENLVVVDKNGIVTKGGRVSGHDAILKAVKEASEHGYQAKKSVPAEVVEQLKAFGGSEEAKNIQLTLKSCDYKPVLNFQYNVTGDIVHLIKAEVKVRSAHLPLVTNLVNLFKKAGDVLVEEIKVFTIPSGTHCDDCKAQLKLPYHYYYWSKVWRCVVCANKSDKNAEDPKKKFTHPENSLLIFTEGSEIDVLRVGSNHQPKTDEQAKQGHGFSCNGCRGGQNTLARYICGGCRREPASRDYVDFCDDCISKIVSNDEAFKNQVQKGNLRDGHKCNHPLLRVNFNVNGYYDF